LNKNVERAKPVDQETESDDDEDADGAKQVAGNLALRCKAGFLRKIAPIMTPECIARIGNKWYGAHNKFTCANMMRAIVRYDNIQGLGKDYDKLRANSPQAEIDVVLRFLRSGQHAYRSHRDNTAALVVRLFEQTPPDDMEMIFIKETVFGVQGGAPLMDNKHPFLVALAAAYEGACHCVAICKIVLTCFPQVRARMWCSSRPSPSRVLTWMNWPVRSSSNSRSFSVRHIF